MTAADVSVRPMRATAPASSRRWRSCGLPLLGLLVAAAVIFSRRPEALLHAQFFAEDGRIYFQDVYNLGIRRAIVLPQAGYYQTFPVVVAWLARLAPLRDAPFVTAWLALLVQALPVALLLSSRAKTICPDIRVRILLALVYLILPNETELDVTAVNEQWMLCVAALLVLFLAPPRRAAWRILDYGILLASGLTGPFCIPLAVIAWVRRRRDGVAAVPWGMAVLLTACAVLQVIAVFVISKHVSGPNVEGRPSPQLAATAGLFAKLVGGRALIGAVIGETPGLDAPSILQWLAIAGAVVALGFVVRSRQRPLQGVIVLGGFVLLAALARPSVPTPAWPIMAATPPNVQRYFWLAQLAVVGLLVWIALSHGPTPLRVLAAGAVLCALVAAGTKWSYPTPGSSPYAQSISRFERQPGGSVATIPIVPAGWSMSLVRR